MPIREVLAVLDVPGEQSADPALGERVRQRVEAGMEAQLVADEADKLAFLQRPHELLEAVGRVADRLLDEQVTACACGGERHLQVAIRGIGDDDRIGTVGQCRLEILECPDAVLGERVAGPGGAVGSDHELAPRARNAVSSRSSPSSMRRFVAWRWPTLPRPTMRIFMAP